MKPVLILTIGYYVLLFEDTVLSEKYELDIVKSVTEVPVSSNREFLDPQWYRSAHSEHFHKETDRTEWCWKGFLRVKDHEKQMGKTFEFQESDKAERLKLYVLASVEDENSEKNSLKIVMASKCPVSPPIYIYVNTLGEGKSDELEFRVVLKDSGPPLNYPDINNYHTKLVEDINEATADDIKSILSEGTVERTLLDTDDLMEKERLRICRGGMQTVPEMMINLRAGDPTGMSKYYVVNQKMDRRTEKPTDIQFLILAFDCPTKPKLYVSVRDGEEAGPILWTMIRSSEMKLRPKFEVMGYSVVLLKSIKIYEEPWDELVGNVSVEQLADEDDNKKRKSDELVNEESVDQLANEDEIKKRKSDELVNDEPADQEADKDENEQKRLSELGESSQPIINEDESEQDQSKLRRKPSRLQRMTSRELIKALGDSNLSALKRTMSGVIAEDDYIEIDTDLLTREERHHICKNAMKAVFGLDVEFIEGTSELGQYYTVEEEVTGEVTEGLRAYECPTKHPAPKIYLNIIDRESIENMVVILFEGKQEHFNRLRVDAHIEK